MSEAVVSAKITEFLASLRRRIGIVDGLAARGVRTADISELAFHAVKDACVVTNPRRVEHGDVKAIYGEAL